MEESVTKTFCDRCKSEVTGYRGTIRYRYQNITDPLDSMKRTVWTHEYCEKCARIVTAGVGNAMNEVLK